MCDVIATAEEYPTTKKKKKKALIFFYPHTWFRLLLCVRQHFAVDGGTADESKVAGFG